MSRKSMEELLTAFDPLHFSGSGSPLFPGTSATPSTTAASASSSSSTLPASTSADTRLAHNSQHAPVSLSQAPLDLLSFEDDASNASQSVPSSSGPHARDAIISRQPLQGTLQSSDPSAVQARAARRQDDLLSELQTADQTFTVPSSGPSKQATSGTAGSPPERPGRHRRTSSGFSPPRRMSKSGLMYDENVINQLRTQHRSGSPQSPIDVSFVPPSPSTQISEEPEVIFHPSSPPAGTTIETLRNSSYFPPASNNRNATIPPPHAASHGHTIFDRPVATSDRQRRTSSSDRQAFHTLNEATSTGPHQSDNRATEQARKQQQPGSRTAFIHNALRSPLPPFASPSLKQSTSSHIPPIPGPSATRAPRDSATQTSNSAPQPSSPDNRLKNTRKATFEFPTFSSLGTSSSGASSNSKTSPLPQHRQPGGSGSNTPSPASSMIIDSDPLPSLVLKVTGAAKESKRVLTEDIADGVRMALPPRIKLCKTWTLLYSLDAHGTSLTTLYTRVQAGLKKSAGGCVLVVKDMEGGIFGAYVNEAFKKSESYYGNGECFLWKVEAFPPGDNFRVGPIVRSYRWTARNDYIILSDSSFLSVGGGDGKFGLWLDSSFDKGFTTSCPAFANEPLCSPSLIRPGVDGNPEGKFEIMAVECWAVG